MFSDIIAYFLSFCKKGTFSKEAKLFMLRRMQRFCKIKIAKQRSCYIYKSYVRSARLEAHVFSEF